jgi:demethoxyubiquinone hydroxylase (CLK1/Coq7/Cat5 family)
MPKKKRDKKLNSQDKKLIEEIVRVDHAGEHGATQIYRGQLAIFNKNTEFGKKSKRWQIRKKYINPNLMS